VPYLSGPRLIFFSSWVLRSRNSRPHGPPPYGGGKPVRDANPSRQGRGRRPHGRELRRRRQFCTRICATTAADTRPARGGGGRREAPREGRSLICDLRSHIYVYMYICIYVYMGPPLCDLRSHIYGTREGDLRI